MHAEQRARWLAVLGFALALSPAVGCHEGEPAAPEPSVADLFELSPLPQQIAKTPEKVQASLSLRRSQFTEDRFVIAEQIASERFAPSALEAQVRARLSEHATSAHLTPALAWLRTTLGQRLVEAVNHSYSPDADAEMKLFAEQKRANPPTQLRLDLVERYDVATDSAEISAKLLLLSALGGNIVLNATKPEAERVELDRLIDIVDSQYALLKPLFVEIATITTLVMMQEFSDADVTSVVRFVESADGMWYHRVTSSALLGAIEETAIEMGQEYLAALDTLPAS